MKNFKLSDLRFYKETNEKYYAFSDLNTRLTLRVIYDGKTIKLYEMDNERLMKKYKAERYLKKYEKLAMELVKREEAKLS